MPLPIWPNTLPQSFLASGLVMSRQSGVLRSPMDTGPAKQRTRFTAVTRSYTATQLFTGPELTTFESFYETDLGQGAASFTWVDPITGVSATLRFMKEYDVTLVTPNDDPDKRVYSVTLPLEKLP